jgi:hypothetical protein
VIDDAPHVHLLVGGAVLVRDAVAEAHVAMARSTAVAAATISGWDRV